MLHLAAQTPDQCVSDLHSKERRTFIQSLSKLLSSVVCRYGEHDHATIISVCITNGVNQGWYRKHHTKRAEQTGHRLAPSIGAPENRATSFAARTHRRNKHNLQTAPPVILRHPLETLKHPRSWKLRHVPDYRLAVMSYACQNKQPTTPRPRFESSHDRTVAPRRARRSRFGASFGNSSWIERRSMESY